MTSIKDQMTVPETEAYAEINRLNDQLYRESVNAKCWCYAKLHDKFEAEDVAQHYSLPLEDVQTSLEWLAERGIIPQPTIERVV